MSLQERVDQLLSELRGKSQRGENLKQLASGLEQLMSTITLNQPKDLGTSSVIGAVAEAKDDEYDTVFFRMIACGHWYGIPPTGAMYSVAEEPQYSSPFRVEPFAVGCYLVLIIMEDMNRDVESNPRFYKQNTSVYYLDVRDVNAGWKNDAPVFIGYLRCFYFAANNKIFRLECPKNILSLHVLDFGCLNKGWQLQTLNHPPSFLPRNRYALKLEFEKDNPVAHRALIFTDHCRLSFDFNTNSFSESVEQLYYSGLGARYFDSKPVFVDNTMYMLCEHQESFKIMAYNHLNRKWCHTPVSGLEGCKHVFPIPYPDDSPLSARLLHLGKKRLCLIWPFTTGRTTRIHCTKFDVHENVEEEKHHANVVFEKVYTITGYGEMIFEAINVSKTRASCGDHNVKIKVGVGSPAGNS